MITASVIITDMHFRAVTVIHTSFTTFSEIRVRDRDTVPVISDFLRDSGGGLMKRFCYTYKGFIKKNRMFNISSFR